MSDNKRTVAVFGFKDARKVAIGSMDVVDTAFADFCTTASTREELEAIVERNRAGARFFLVYRGDAGSRLGGYDNAVDFLEGRVVGITGGCLAK